MMFRLMVRASVLGTVLASGCLESVVATSEALQATSPQNEDKSDQDFSSTSTSHAIGGVTRRPC